MDYFYRVEPFLEWTSEYFFPFVDGDDVRMRQQEKKRWRPERRDSFPPSPRHFDLLYRTIYIKTERPVYIFFLHHSPSHLSSSSFFLFALSPPPSPSLPLLCLLPLPTLCFSLSSGRRLHAKALWITELQDTRSKNCSIFPRSVFLERWEGRAARYDAAISPLWLCCMRTWISFWCIIDTICFFPDY